MANKHYFYVLRCADNSFYAGYTTDVKRREAEHNSKDKCAKYTRYRQPVKVIHYESFETRSLAMKAEAQFKKLTRREKERYIEHATTEKLSRA